MKISVIIPARNESAQIAGTVNAVFESARLVPHPHGVEVIVVDNGSTDDTAEQLSRLAEHGALQLVPYPARGAARARNAGARVATGTAFVFIDADTRIPRNGLPRIFEHLSSGRHDAGIFALMSQQPGLRAWCWWTFWNQVRRLPIARAKALPAFMFCTRDAFDRFGPFDETVAIAEEWPILAGVYRWNPQRLIYDRSIVAHSSSRRMQRQRYGYTRTFAKYAAAVLFPPARIHFTDTIREESP
jgi:glycosyltransferase involved in cell wall biosynthesis